MIFRAATEADAVQAADFLGKKRVVRRSWGYSAGKRNVNYSETEEHKSELGSQIEWRASHRFNAANEKWPPISP